MLLRVIHPNLSSIMNVTGLDEKDVEPLFYTPHAGKVLIYTPSGRWAFVEESHIDKIFDGLLDILES